MIAMNTKMEMNNLKMDMKRTENEHVPEHEPYMTNLKMNIYWK